MITAKNKTEATEAIISRKDFRYNDVIGRMEKSIQELTEIEDLIEFAKQNNNKLYVLRKYNEPFVAISEKNRAWFSPSPYFEKDLKIVPGVLWERQFNT